MKLHFLFLGLLCVCSPAFASGRARSVLLEYKDEIVTAAGSFGIAPRLLASIVYAEHALNVRPGEELLDRVFAMSGYNASIGVAQVKVETARWVREQVENRSGVFYNHAHAVTLRAASPDFSVGQLSEPGANLHYAAAYTALIAKAWAPFFDDVFHQHARVGIIATLYSLGLSRSDGTLRLPHVGARMNHFGEVAQTFFDSFELRQDFSQ